MEQESKIGQDFNVLSLTLFALPSFFTNLFAQLFKSLDDGLFISRYVGETALSSLNLLNPLAGVQLGIEHLFSLGASNISAKLMGQKNRDEANRIFSRVVISGLICGTLFAILINLFSAPILKFLGADEAMSAYAIYQFRIVYAIAPIPLLNRIFSCYFPTAGKPKMGMYCSIINGVTNIGLDILLIVVYKMGVIGACIATAMGEIVVFFVGLFFFMNKKHDIYFVAPEGNFIKTSLESAKYAMPQCINSVSFAVTSYISNLMILQVIGANGIAANAIVSDVRKILTSGLVGFAICVGPVISYNVGSRNLTRLTKTLKNVLNIWLAGSVLLLAVGLLLRKPLISMFMSKTINEEFYNMAYFALTIEIFSTPFVSGCILINRTFIALGNPKAAIISSTFRNLIIKSIVFIALPKLMGAMGIWLSVTVAEFIAFIFGSYLIWYNRDNYGYGKEGVAYLLK